MAWARYDGEGDFIHARTDGWNSPTPVLIVHAVDVLSCQHEHQIGIDIRHNEGPNGKDWLLCEDCGARCRNRNGARWAKRPRTLRVPR